MIEFETAGGRKYVIEESSLAYIEVDPRTETVSKIPILRIAFRSRDALLFTKGEVDIEKLFATLRLAMAHGKNVFRPEKPVKGGAA